MNILTMSGGMMALIFIILFVIYKVYNIILKFTQKREDELEKIREEHKLVEETQRAEIERISIENKTLERQQTQEFMRSITKAVVDVSDALKQVQSNNNNINIIMSEHTVRLDNHEDRLNKHEEIINKK